MLAVDLLPFALTPFFHCLLNDPPSPCCTWLYRAVSTSTVAGFFCGSAMMMFSGTCAVMGTCILSGE